jgi:phosphohistidine swiveling domain-containing protein
MAARNCYVDEGQTLERQFPHLYTQLLDVRERVESHYGDVCDIEFTIQEGRLFILGVRAARRTPRANLRFLLQFLIERKIRIRDVLSRVTLADVEDFLQPEILNLTALVPLGRGLPGCGGAATGEIVLDASAACDRARAGHKILLVKEEVSPEDLEGVHVSQGVVTACGGMTSHAAMACRGWGIPCVVGFVYMRIRHDAGVVSVGEGQDLRHGEWMTIDGVSGRVYAGQGEIALRTWHDWPELLALASVIDLGLLTDEVPAEAIGRVWRIRDCFAHRVPLTLPATSKKPSASRRFVSFAPPSRTSVQEARAHAVPIRDEDRENYTEILLSLSATLSRLLASALGLGKHYLYFRPLWDPKDWVTIGSEDRRRQFVGFEYFGINGHIAHLVDVATVTFLLDLQVDSLADEWFLDFTNPNGESLVMSPAQASAYTLLVNDAVVSHEDLPSLYQAIRRREYAWRFYEDNDISYKEITEFLADGAAQERSKGSLTRLCHHLGLLRDGRLTATGKSLIGQCSRKQQYEYIRPE